MAYEFEGDAIDRLLLSYQNDRDPYITAASVEFPVRDDEFREIRRLKEIFFPKYWNCGFITMPENRKELIAKINDFGQALFCGIQPYFQDEEEIVVIVDKTMAQLPEIREALKMDVEAAYKGDPAARSYTEIIRSYPGFYAILVQRVAHVLYQLNVPAYPRELTEHIHSTTGVDIHPGAKIGRYFFMDHGTGVVIGETTEIGDHVRIYQGVTLGALHFEKDERGVLKKGHKRHPTIGTYVVIGMGAKIVGLVVIGNHVSIGANSWIQEDIPDYTNVFVSEHPKLVRKRRDQP